MTSEMSTPGSMFERYGGVKFVMQFVLRFYDRVLESNRLAPFFVNTNMQELVEHQAKFISTLMGGPTNYNDAMLQEVHSNLAIDNQAFDEMIQLFRSTLQESNLADLDVEAIITNLNMRRGHIVRERFKDL